MSTWGLMNRPREVVVELDGEERRAPDLVALVRASGTDHEAAEVLAMAIHGAIPGVASWPDLSGWVRDGLVRDLLPVVKELRR